MPQDARRQKLEVYGQAGGLKAFFLKGAVIGVADDLLDRLDELYGVVSQRTVRRTGYQMQGNVARFVLRQLYAVKQGFGTQDWFRAEADDENDIAILQRGGERKRFLGVFSLKAKSAEIKADAPDGEYQNLIDGETVTVRDGRLPCQGRPIILRVE